MKNSALSLVTAVVASLLSQAALAQNTPNNYTGTGTGNVTTGANWSLGHVPTVTEDAVFNANPGIRTYGTGATVGSPLTVGSLNVTAATGTYSIRNSTTGATNAFLTLGGAGNLGNSVSGNSADLLYAATGSTLQLLGPNGSSGTGVLNVALGQSGNFNAAGTIVISSVISDGGNNFSMNKTGAGTLTLSAANTYSGGTTLSAGTLNVNNATALGSGTFTIAGGTLSNTSGSSVTVANSQTWSGDFSFAGTSGTSSLVFSGPVTLTGNRSIAVSGATSTLTISGSIAGSGFSLTKAGPGTGTLILNATNSYNGGTFLSSGTLIASADGALGSGNVSLTAGNVTLTLQNGATNNYIADTANFNIGFTSDTVNLNFTGTDTISSFTVAGVAQMAGVYGAVGSGAQFELAQLNGTGTLTVLVPEPATYMLMGLGVLICAQQFRRRRS